MNEKALQTLEYNKIMERLSDFAVSPMAKKIVSELVPSNDLKEIERTQAETTDAVSCALRKGNIPLGGLGDISASIKRAEMGGCLSIPELMKVGDTLYVCRKVKNYSKDEGKHEHYPLLEPLFDGLMLLNNLEGDINSKIVSETDLADDASPELYNIRREIKVSNDRVKEKLNGIIYSQSYKNMLQDAVVTIRGGRYCVPIKQEYKNAFNGMIHDQSSTGATLFMEPMVVVELNNRVRELEIKEKNEIEKILQKLSGLVAESAEIITANLEILIHLDFLFAKASLSLSYNGSCPRFNKKGYINIKRGRHPLLDKATVVPTDVYLGDKFTTLLITGPNTGGKTVTLKTLGLFSLMGQAGLHIPAMDNSELAVFDDVFADIGDEQNIEQSLSTFSSHMTNIVRILGEMTSNSLVLLDELGAGTDPTEGAALAMSIISHLHMHGVRTAVTTHYSELKVFALSTDGVENACCEFDVETLRPTYRLLIGIPGKSNAFAISRRIGLPDEIIDAAREFISHEDIHFEDVITDLEISRKSVEIEQARAEQFRMEAERLKKDLETSKEKINAQKEKIIADAKAEARTVLQQAKDEADKIIKQMQRSQNEANRKSAEDGRQALREKVELLEQDIYKDDLSKRKLKAPVNIKVGDRVFVQAFNQTGIVDSGPDKNGDVVVKAGAMKIKTNIKDLMLDESKEKPSAKTVTFTSKAKAGKAMAIRNEVDCRGLTADEAIEKVDKYLDDAHLSNLKIVTIIHGKGTGVLRQAVHQHLKRHPHVASYRLGVYGEGENGVTVVDLH